ncbi:MAG: SpoIID/LytB domain-containing protein [Calditrichaeota bacterium]|nr:MAG: SpoIID/LytB domain-containing protein [Calditrichota bacterium]
MSFIKYRTWPIFTIIFVFVLGCSASALKYETLGRQPRIRVGLLEGQSTIKFIIAKGFSLYDPDGRFIGRGMKGIRWQAKAIDYVPAQSVYRLRYAENVSRSQAERNGRDLQRMNLRSEIVPSREAQKSFTQKDDLYDVLLWSTFETAAQAANYRSELGKSFPLEVIKMETSSAGGQIEISSEQSPKKFQVPNGTRIEAEKFALMDMPIGNGYHWESEEDIVFRGSLQLIADAQNKLSAINIVSAEEYLRSVVPSEMPWGFPTAALKAQAITARSELLVKIDRGVHSDKNYDICATVHCQVYGGVGKEHAQTDRAVKDTYGQVLKAGGRIIDAVYSAVCGGHTENNETVWAGEPQAQLRGRFDGNGAPDVLGGRLQTEATVKKWVNAKAPVYCNTLGAEIPEPLMYTQKYFRWQMRFTRQELQESISKATGTNPGLLRAIIPLQRGVSGRIERLKIVGSTQTFEIERDLPIRKAMSAKTLYSSCFVVTPELDQNGTPVRFTFQGAGWGHGVGMCQAGAARMALTGKSMAEILGHYYRNVVVERAY